MDCLPMEIVDIIFAYLRYHEEQERLGKTCRRLARIFKNHVAWKIRKIQTSRFYAFLIALRGEPLFLQQYIPQQRWTESKFVLAFLYGAEKRYKESSEDSLSFVKTFQKRVGLFENGSEEGFSKAYILGSHFKNLLHAWQEKHRTLDKKYILDLGHYLFYLSNDAKCLDWEYRFLRVCGGLILVQRELFEGSILFEKVEELIEETWMHPSSVSLRSRFLFYRNISLEYFRENKVNLGRQYLEKTLRLCPSEKSNEITWIYLFRCCKSLGSSSSCLCNEETVVFLTENIFKNEYYNSNFLKECKQKLRKTNPDRAKLFRKYCKKYNISL